MNDIESLKAQIEERREELEYEYEDTDIGELEINNKLRDEFNDPIYKQALIDLGINEELSGDLMESEEDIPMGSNNSNEGVLKLLISSEEDLQETEMILRGHKKEKKRWWKSREEMIPSEDIAEILLFIRTQFQPQNIMTKLSQANNSLKDYTRNLNYTMTYFNNKFTDYPDHIVSLQEKQFIIKFLLNKCQVVLNAIRNGEYGETTKQISTSTYHERADPQPDLKQQIKDKISNL